MVRSIFWVYTEKLSDGRWKCIFCPHIFGAGTSGTRIRWHLSGVKGQGVQICRQVPKNVQEKALQACPNNKRKTIMSDSEMDEMIRELQQVAEGNVSFAGAENRIDDMNGETIQLLADEVRPVIENSWGAIHTLSSRNSGTISTSLQVQNDEVAEADPFDALRPSTSNINVSSATSTSPQGQNTEVAYLMSILEPDEMIRGPLLGAERNFSFAEAENHTVQTILRSIATPESLPVHEHDTRVPVQNNEDSGTQQGQILILGLGRLIHLRRLGIVKLRKEDGKDLCSSIDKLKNLRALSVTSITESEVIDLEYLSSPPQFLQRLYLTGRLERLPDWITSLDSLVNLVLKWSRVREDPLLFLQNLPNLVRLELVQAYNGEALDFNRRGFQKLKFLGLNKLQRLKFMTVQKGAMPSLRKLVIEDCKLLQQVPSGIKHLTELTALEFFDMPRDFLKRLQPDGNMQRAARTFLQMLVALFCKILQMLPCDMPYGFVRRLHPGGEGEDYHEVRNVPEIYCTYQVNGNWDVYYNYARTNILMERQPHWKP